jgi:RNA polymerase sigma-70 factor, ECF subfamily
VQIGAAVGRPDRKTIVSENDDTKTYRVTNVSVFNWQLKIDTFAYAQFESQDDYNFLPNWGLPFIHRLQRRHRFSRSRSIPSLRRKSEVPKFHDLVEQEIPRLRRYARALTRKADRADDLVQDTLLRAIAKAHLWQPGTDLRAWLFTVMHNQYVNGVRRAMRDDNTVDIDQMSSSLAATTDPTGSRQLHELDRALGCLPEEQRAVVLLVGLEGMSYETAAEVLSVPVGTVRSRLSRGRDALRRLMGLPSRADAATTPAAA